MPNFMYMTCPLSCRGNIRKIKGEHGKCKSTKRMQHNISAGQGTDALFIAHNMNGCMTCHEIIMLA